MHQGPIMILQIRKFQSLFTTIVFVLSLPLVIQPSFSAEDPQPALTKKEKRMMKRSFKKISRTILEDPELARKYFEIITNCENVSERDCQNNLRTIVGETAQTAEYKSGTNSMTFGICKSNENSQSIHRAVVSKKEYDCKLSSNGKVYNKTVSRKMYGPGIWWDKQALVLMCTSRAYGTTMRGTNISVGAYFGISLATLVGKAGVCLVVGAGKSAGVYVGADVYKFENLE
jgi:hypothetical protein